MRSLFQDLRYGCRRLLRSPAFTITVLLTLALGIGVNTAIFSIVNAVFFKPLPYKNPERLMVVWQSAQQQGHKRSPVYPPTLLSGLQEQGMAFEEVAGYVSGEDIGFDIVGGKQPERVMGAVVSDNFFSMLGVDSSAGRTFLPGDDDAGSDQVVVISEILRDKLFDGEADLIGKALILNGRSYTVIGVVRASFDFPRGSQLWVPGPLQADRAMNTALLVTHALMVVARLKPEITREQAQASLDLFAGEMQPGRPQKNGNPGFWITPLQEELFGKIRPSLLILWGAVVFVLMIACANVANLQLARAAGRRPEMAIRSALGASRLRLVRQLLTENALLAVLGGGLGFLLSVWAVNSLIAIGPSDLSALKGLVIDGRVLGFTLGASLLTGMLFGLVPALQSSKPDMQEALKEGSRT
ncbi:MAG: ABC transporter permease, partial [Blastocatellia bacterium]